MSISIVKSKMICGFDDLFAVDIGYKNYRIGVKTHPWGFRIMFLWWHICWHRKIMSACPTDKQHAKERKKFIP